MDEDYNIFGGGIIRAGEAAKSELSSLFATKYNQLEVRRPRFNQDFLLSSNCKQTALSYRSASRSLDAEIHECTACDDH
ncbi:MAG TPA: hypothetical protein VFN27_07090, partial [Xanthobacteraceae bacterium]|nr:hypothetical protein [Xanthobacteraceae bacterium]